MKTAIKSKVAVVAAIVVATVVAAVVAAVVAVVVSAAAWSGQSSFSDRPGLFRWPDPDSGSS